MAATDRGLLGSGLVSGWQHLEARGMVPGRQAWAGRGLGGLRPGLPVVGLGGICPMAWGIVPSHHGCSLPSLQQQQPGHHAHEFGVRKPGSQKPELGS